MPEIDLPYFLQESGVIKNYFCIFPNQNMNAFLLF